MSPVSAPKNLCAICEDREAEMPREEARLCADCFEKSETLFDAEMNRIELIRTIRGRDVELYDIEHPESTADQKHCGQVILIKAGQGFEVKICLRSNALDWMSKLLDPDTGFASKDSRLDALIGNVSLLMESWGGGPHYMDIFYVDKVVSTEGEI
jgi:hypothetical protein